MIAGSDYVTNFSSNAIFKNALKWTTYNQVPSCHVSYANGTHDVGVTKVKDCRGTFALLFCCDDRSESDPGVDKFFEFLQDLNMLADLNPHLNDGTDNLVQYWKIARESTDKGTRSPLTMAEVTVEARYFDAPNT